MTTDIAVAAIKKNQREEVRVGLKSYEGHRYIDLRIFADDGNEHRPTKKGVTLKPALVRQLIEALEQVEMIARTEGLL